MSFRSASPPLPTFGIRDLAGPSNPPGLISITKSQYDSTIKSQPDAALLYVDDDDGEVVTVGSSFELSQRLEEPVPRSNADAHFVARDPRAGHLVHVFDIQHSSGSLAEWRDHEAYSSKRWRPEPTLVAQPSNSSFRLDDDADLAAKLSPMSLGSPADQPKDEPQEETTPSPNLHQRSEQTAKILDGIEEHLSGLADILQIAASTLQKAADKTRETDTSVVEDILKGVRGILTEVGSFGVEVYKEMTKKENDTEDENANREISEESSRADDAQSPTSTDGHPTGTSEFTDSFLLYQRPSQCSQQTKSNGSGSASDDLDRWDGIQIYRCTCGNSFYSQAALLSHVRQKTTKTCTPADERLAAKILAHEAKEKVELRKIRKAEPGKTASLLDEECVTYSDASSKPSPKVKFAFVEDESADESVNAVGSSSSNPIIIDDESSEEEIKDSRKKRILDFTDHRWHEVDDRISLFPNTRSILDDSSEDPDFTARYPPLRSIRRTRSTIEPGRTSAQSSRPLQAFRPFALAPRETVTETADHSTSHNSPPLVPTEQKTEASEATRKPVPGAWPDVKNEPVPPAPSANESSGAFFNRMTGRDQAPQSNGGLQRANTTASSNLASRLTGPFDPGFAYQPAISDNPSSWQFPYQTYRQRRRPYERSTDSFRSFREPADAHAQPGFMATPPKPKPSPPFLSSAQSVRQVSIKSPTSESRNPYTSNVFSKFESHRGVRHHRSVPQFNPYIPRPPPAVRHHSIKPTPKPNLAEPHSSQEEFRRHPQADSSYKPTSISRLGYPEIATKPKESDTLARPTSPPPSVNIFSKPLHSAQQLPTASHTIRQVAGSNVADDAPASKNKFDECVEHLKMCGFGIDDDNLRDRLHVYAVAADGDVHEAVEMIEEDRRVSLGLN